ncbi:hypothetical protein HDU92_003693 [Lobulomyces angularis]|nr:hypothetical protein HDU92_003693 [Lobulomyces angularis]
MDEKKMPDTQNQEKNLLADEKMEKKKDLILILLNIIAFLISIDFKVLKKSNLFAKCENNENEFGFFEKLNDFEEGSKKASSYSEYALSFIWKWKPNTVKSEEEELLEKMNTRKKNLPKEVLPIIFTDLFDVLSNITSEEKRQLKLDFLSYFQLYVNYFKCLLKNREKFKLSSLNLNYLKLFSYNLKYVTSEENILYLDSEDLEDDSLQLILKVEVEIINYNLMNFQVDLFKKDEEETETEKVTTDQVEDIVKKSEISSSNSINDISEEKVKKKFKCDKKFDFLVLKCFLMLNYFISFGDRFLSDPHHYDRLFYEIIRNADALKNLYNYIVKKMEQNLKENVNDNASFFSEQLKNFDNLNLIFNYFLPKLNDFQQEDLNETNILDMLKENYTNLNLIIFEDEDDCWSLYCEDVTASELDIIKNFGPVLSEFSF